MQELPLILLRIAPALKSISEINTINTESETKECVTQWWTQYKPRHKKKEKKKNPNRTIIEQRDNEVRQLGTCYLKDGMYLHLQKAFDHKQLQRLTKGALSSAESH